MRPVGRISLEHHEISEPEAVPLFYSSPCAGMTIDIDKNAIDYCPNYCEENVWLLAQRPEFAGHDPRVVFISNTRRRVLFQAQRLCEGNRFMCWDYHVILLARDDSHWLVFDADSLLPFGCRLRDYLAATFPLGSAIAEAPLFRMLSAGEYIRNLSTDRRHMRNVDGTFSASPPDWPVIQMDRSAEFNLWEFVDMKEGGLGEVLGLPQFEKRFLYENG